MSFFEAAPDDALQMLEIGAEYRLSAQQYFIAKQSALEAISQAEDKDLTILDFVQLWEKTQALSEFAARLRRVFLLQ